MPNLKKCKGIKLVELDIFLMTGLFDPFNRKTKKNNLSFLHVKKKSNDTEGDLTNSDPSTEKKLDFLVENLERERKSKEKQPIPQKLEDKLREITETKKHIEGRSENSRSETEPGGTFNSLNSESDLFEISLSDRVQPDSKNVRKTEKTKRRLLDPGITKNRDVEDKNISNQTSSKDDNMSKHAVISFTHRIRIRNKEEREKLKDITDEGKTAKNIISFKNPKFKDEKKEVDNSFTKAETKKNRDRSELEGYEGDKSKKSKLEEKREKELEIKRLVEEKKKKLELKKARKAEKIKERERNRGLKKLKTKKTATQEDQREKNPRDKINRFFNKKWPSLLMKNKENLTDSDQQNIPRDIDADGKEDKEGIKNLTPELKNYTIDEKKEDKENPILDEDVKKVLLITDDLLGNLPGEVIDDFAKSKDFDLYEKVLTKYKIK